MGELFVFQFKLLIQASLSPGSLPGLPPVQRPEGSCCSVAQSLCACPCGLVPVPLSLPGLGLLCSHYGAVASPTRLQGGLQALVWRSPLTHTQTTQKLPEREGTIGSPGRPHQRLPAPSIHLAKAPGPVQLQGLCAQDNRVCGEGLGRGQDLQDPLCPAREGQGSEGPSLYS